MNNFRSAVFIFEESLQKEFCSVTFNFEPKVLAQEEYEFYHASSVGFKLQGRLPGLLVNEIRAFAVHLSLLPPYALLSGIWPNNFFALKHLRKLGEKDRKAFECLRCGNRYVRKHALKSHLRWECGVPPQFQCMYCGYQCKLKHHLKSHISRMHSVNVCKRPY